MALCLPLARTFAAAAAVLLAAAVVPPADALPPEAGLEAAALGRDDQCAEEGRDGHRGGDACAVNALQLRRTGLREGSGGGSARRRAHVVDISEEWEVKLTKRLTYIALNLSRIEWKLYYLGQDIRSVNKTLTNGSGVAGGVNGTQVDWTKHPDTWIPTFNNVSTNTSSNGSLLAYGAVPEEEEDAIEDYGDADSDSDDDSGSGRRRRDTKRMKRVNAWIEQQDVRLDRATRSTSALQDMLSSMGTYMETNQQMRRCRPVLRQEASLTAEEEDNLLRALAMAADPEAAAQPNVTLRAAAAAAAAADPPGTTTQDFLMKALQDMDAMDEQVKEFWLGFGRLGQLLQALKRRVELYNKAASAPPGQGDDPAGSGCSALQKPCFADEECCSCICGPDAVCVATTSGS